MNFTSRRIAIALVGVAVASVAACSSSDEHASTTTSETRYVYVDPSTQAPAGSEPTAISTATEINTLYGQSITIDNQAIAESYGDRGGPDGPLGRPLGPVVGLPTGGQYITFVNGTLYQNPLSHNVYAVHGAIGAFWGTLGHEAGRLGYPTSDEAKTPEGLTQTFDHGTLVYADGKVTLASG